MQDRNFDELALRFQRNIYDSLKGRVRLAVLERDLGEFLPQLFREQTAAELPLRILDAGGGQGPLSLALAQRGHHVMVCDISATMLEQARARAEALGVVERVEFFHGPMQSLPKAEGFDLILCHAVLEWVAEPQAVLQKLRSLMAAGACLSLSFYSEAGMVMKNLLRMNFKKLREPNFKRFRGSLTPDFPRRLEEVELWLQDAGFKVEARSGIRVFQDFILDRQQSAADPEGVVEMELKYSRLEPYWRLGRYLHLLAH